MQRLTDDGQRIVAEIAARHGISEDAATHMLMAVAAGGGTQAQFNHPELGGMGQWSQGGMTMVGDMFNNGLKARVDALCNDLAGVVRSHGLFAAPVSSQSQSQGGSFQGNSLSGSSLFVPQTGGWPEELGQPASVGSQNDMRYAYFPQTRRLALDIGGRVRVFDTGDHAISGFGQAQSGGQSLTFTSQHGLVRVADLREITEAAAPSPASGDTRAEASGAAPAPSVPEDTLPAGATPLIPDPPLSPAPAPAPQPGTPPQTPAMSDDQIFSRIEKLAALHDKGILSDAEYEAKKAELLARL